MLQTGTNKIMTAGVNMIVQACLWELAGLVKSACRYRWDWSTMSAGAGVTGQNFQMGLAKSVRRNWPDWSKMFWGAGRTGQNYL